MSRTYKDKRKYNPKKKIPHRVNTYGLCHCSQCSAIRRKSRSKSSECEVIKKKIRYQDKSGRRITKGVYIA